MATLNYPFDLNKPIKEQIKNQKHIDPVGVPPEIVQIIDLMLEKNPDTRISFKDILKKPIIAEHLKRLIGYGTRILGQVKEI